MFPEIHGPEHANTGVQNSTQATEYSQPVLEVIDLGQIAYREAWALQQRVQQTLIAGNASETLLLCEHPAVITLGTSTKSDSVLAKSENLSDLGIEVLKVERGGDATWHGPGQLVCYPLLDLRKPVGSSGCLRAGIRTRQDVNWYLRTLEQTLILTLADLGIEASRISGRTGVWILEQESKQLIGKARKIASIGVRISRWCTLHGFSLNVDNCQEGFALIHPCGYQDVSVTSLRELGVQISLDVTKQLVLKNFLKLFEYNTNHA